MQAGCRCPVISNSHGEGYMGTGLYLMAEGCPVHPMHTDDAPPDDLRAEAERRDRNT